MMLKDLILLNLENLSQNLSTLLDIALLVNPSPNNLL